MEIPTILDTIDTRVLASALAGRRRLVENTCPRCGHTFKGIKRRKYCSDSCRVRSYQIRHEAAQKAVDAVDG